VRGKIRLRQQRKKAWKGEGWREEERFCTSIKTPGIPKPLANGGTGNPSRIGEFFKVLVPFSELRDLCCRPIEGSDVDDHVPFSGVTVE